MEIDWATFLKDNSQALFTLGGVVLGSVIAFLSNYINNIFQANENKKEREEKRNEAKAQLHLELKRKDVEHIEKSIALIFGIINTVRYLNMRKFSGAITEEQKNKEIRLLLSSETGKGAELMEFDGTTEMIVSTFGDDIHSSYSKFNKLFGEYIIVLANPKSTDKDYEKIKAEIVSSGGKLRIMLRDKLISIREIDSRK